MFPTKLKMLTAVALGTILVCSGIGLLSRTLAAAEQMEPSQEGLREGKADAPKQDATKETAAKAALQQKGKERDAAKKDMEAIQGTWTAVIVERNGQKAPEGLLKDFKVVFKGAKMIINPNSDNRTSAFKLDPSKKPKWMDNTPHEGPAKGKSLPAIYELDGDTLKLCFNNEGGNERPNECKTTPGSGLALFVLKREKEGKEKQEKK